MKPKISSYVIRYGLLAVLCFIVLVPFFYLILTSFKTLDDVTYGGGSIFPTTNAFVENFMEVINTERFRFFRYFLNTIFICIMKIAGVLITCSLTAYALHRFKCKLSNIYFALLIAIMFLPGELLGIPFYEMMVNLGIQYSKVYLPIWMGAWFGIDITIIFLFKQYYASSPMSLVEAAKIDGCNELTAFVRIVLPLAKPVIMTTVILYFTGTYNDVYSPSLYIRGNDWDSKVVSQSIAIFENMYNYGSPDFIVPWNLVSIATLISIIPVLAFFFVAQKSFIESLTGGAVKG